MDKQKRAVLDLDSLNEEGMSEFILENKRLCSCTICHNYNECARKAKDLLFCVNGRGAKCITQEKICFCVKCPVHFKMKFSKMFFCARGSEKEQKAKKE